MSNNRFRYQILVMVVLFFSGALFSAADTSTSPMSRFQPFMGRWKTVSVYPESGLRVEGELGYRWVLGKNWVLVEFVGKHPTREYWEAYALIKYDSLENHYVSYEFFNEEGPVQMMGKWITPRTLRFEVTDKNGRSGIDYTLRDDGTIFQENWIESQDRERKITLKTRYTRK